MKEMKNKTGKILIPLAMVMLFMACKKNSDDDPVNPGNNPPPVASILPVPGSFSQKVLMEQFTGAWNGGCPDGIYRMDQLIAGDSKIIGVNIHMGDAMEIPAFQDLMAVFNSNNLPQFPSAMVNRLPSLGNVLLTKTQWASNATVAKGKTASCGLAFQSTLSGNTAQIEIHAGFGSILSGSYNLTVYLVENRVTGTGSSYDQVNTHSSNDPAGPYYNLPSPITGFEHNHVLRKVLSAGMGDGIPVEKLVPGGEYIRTYTADITGKIAGNMEIVAFINKTGSTATTHEIMNVQTAPVNTLKNWD